MIATRRSPNHVAYFHILKAQWLRRFQGDWNRAALGRAQPPIGPTFSGECASRPGHGHAQRTPDQRTVGQEESRIRQPAPGGDPGQTPSGSRKGSQSPSETVAARRQERRCRGIGLPPRYGGPIRREAATISAFALVWVHGLENCKDLGAMWLPVAHLAAAVHQPGPSLLSTEVRRGLQWGRRASPNCWPRCHAK